MTYVKWVLLLIPSYFMAIFGRLVAPILPLFASDDGWLPDWLSWFQTPFDSLDGDDDHKQTWPGTDAWSTYKRRVAWQWYYIKHYTLFGSKRCVRIGAGWKIWGVEKLYTEPAQYFSVCNPVKTAFDA